MKLAFLRAVTPTEHLFARGGMFWHSACQFSDGWWGSSRPRGGVFLASHQGVGELRNYEFIDTPLSDLEETRVREWFARHVGDRYDWSAFFGGPDSPNAEFCTESIIIAMKTVGFFQDLVPHRTQSSALYEAAKKEFGGAV